MNTNLPIELSEHTFSALSAQASAVGKTPAELAASVVETLYAGHSVKSAGAQAARAQFESKFGSVDLGRPIGIVNDAIDVDLACQYGASNSSN